MVGAATLVLSPGREANNILRRRTGAPAERFAVWHNAHSFEDRRPPKPVALSENEPFTVAYLGGIQPVIRGLEVQIEAPTHILTHVRLDTAMNGWLIRVSGHSRRIWVVNFAAAGVFAMELIGLVAALLWIGRSCFRAAVCGYGVIG
jgi:hypothetical protein